MGTLEREVFEAAQGSERGWESLFQKYAPMVKKILAWGKWHFSREEQEDLLQEVFLDLVKHLPSFKGESSFSTYLTTLVKNNCITAIRRKVASKRGKGGRPLSLWDEEGNALQISSGENIEEEHLAQSDRGDVLRCLRLLPRECQLLLYQRYFLDLSYDEIVHRHGVPLGTVSSRLKRCLLRLQEAYKGRVGSGDVDEEVSQKMRQI